MVEWWSEEKWGWASHLISERYPTIEGAELDFTVWHSPQNQTVDGEDVDRRTAQVFEVETGMSDWSGLQSDAHKMAYLGGQSWWVFPTREVLVEVLDELSMRGYTGLDEVPETLAIRGFRDTYDKRLEDAEREMAELNHPPVKRVRTFKQLADDLRDSRPELFYGPKDSR
jgi:hypothetical protein